MTAPLADLCSAWATTDDLCEPCNDYDADFAELDDWLFIASDILYRMTGYLWPGFCEETVRPCAQRRPGDHRWFASQGWTAAAGWATFPWSHYCSCQSRDACGCSHVPTIQLPTPPILEVSEILIDGAVLDPAAYRIDEWEWLVRVDGEGWPCCQDMLAESTEEDTFEITYTYGQDPPASGVAAAAALACDLYRGCNGVDGCDLPDSVRQVARLGVTHDLTGPLVATIGGQGRTGIRIVDLFLDSVPHRTRPGFIINPDDVVKARRTGT